jgi:hypothetical protein
MNSWDRIEAERAFDRAARARRRAALIRRLRHQCTDCRRLAIHDERTLSRSGAGTGSGIREIPLDAISGTLEPSRSS